LGLPQPGRQGRPDVQRSVYLANEDDHIYKSDDVAGEFAYLLKYSSKYPVFIRYEAIAQLKADPTIQQLWSGSSGIEEFFRKDLMKLLKQNSPDAQRIMGYIGYPYMYDGKAGTLEASDFGLDGIGIIIVAAITGGPKVYQQGGGSRLPAAMGVLGTLNLSRQDALTALGIPQDRWDDYKRLVVAKKLNWYAYDSARTEAKQSGVNFYEYADENTKTYFYYVSNVEVTRNANAHIQIAGNRFGDNDFSNIGPNTPEELAVKTAFAKLGLPTADTDWVPGTSLNRKDRGEGQAKAMLNWNAMGAAAYANKFLGQNYPMDQNWEWLHIRGAQIGGATDGTNLVPGLYVTNSFMIPYETMVMQYARADPTNFFARFRVSPTGTLFARYITIEIKATGHKMLGDLEPTLLGRFDVLQGKVVDKLSNEIMKRNLDRRAVFDED
jgi:hypothetical protein